MKKVLIADDHPIYRNGLKLILTYELDMYVAEAKDGIEALDYLQHNTIDILIVDLDLPGASGLDVVKQMRKTQPHLPSLVVSALPEEEYAARAIKAGATGFLGKKSDKEKLLVAVKTMLRDGHKTKKKSQTLPEPDAETEQAPHRKLSNREYEVFYLLASGKTVGEIADKLCLSEKTISTHRAHVLQKLELTNNADIVHYGVKHRLVKIV